MTHCDIKPGSTALEIFRFLHEGLAAGARGALVTMTLREGSSVRALGSHMAVMEGGRYAGSFSGGCIEASIVAEAQWAIGERKARTVRYGRGSPYIDIRLPCGGAVELLFDPDPVPKTISQIVGLLEARSPVTLELFVDGRIRAEEGWHKVPAEWLKDRFVVRHAPPLRLIVAGEGAETVALARMARAYGAELLVLSADGDVLVSVARARVAVQQLYSAGAIPEITADRWTAIALLFHNHEWEIRLLQAALATPAFWIGAMGSQQTQEARLAALVASGVPAAQLARVRGPIGLIPSTRDPSTMALSALAEIVGDYQKTGR